MATERRVDATLATVAERVEAEAVRPPAVVVIGDVVTVGPERGAGPAAQGTGSPEEAGR